MLDDVVKKIKDELKELFNVLRFCSKKAKHHDKFKKDNDYVDYHFSQLTELTSYDGVWELSYQGKSFKMINS